MMNEFGNDVDDEPEAERSEYESLEWLVTESREAMRTVLESFVHDLDGDSDELREAIVKRIVEGATEAAKWFVGEWEPSDSNGFPTL
jgi:hypothetical protein